MSTHGDRYGVGHEIPELGRWPEGELIMTTAPDFQPPYQFTPPPKQKHTLRNVLIAATVVVILMMAGCLALVGTAANEIDKSITAQETEIGGTNNPLTIKEGKAFEVRGFTYKAGWSLETDALGDLSVVGLKVTNNRDDRDGALVEIRVWMGKEVAALADCTTEQILPKTTTTLSCTSSDKLPPTFTRITISDTF